MPQHQHRTPVTRSRRRLALVALATLALTGCGTADPAERACSTLRDWAESGDVAREVYMMSPDERRDTLRPIANDAAASEQEEIRAAGYAVSVGMDDPRAAVLGIAQLARACGPA